MAVGDKESVEYIYFFNKKCIYKSQCGFKRSRSSYWITLRLIGWLSGFFSIILIDEWSLGSK